MADLHLVQEHRPPELSTTAHAWYKDAVIYELHVRAFYDGNGDGIGDFAGLTQKLDYIKDLGVTALWLLPFYPSPLKDDGYDISNYTDIHPSYGSLDDFRAFLREAHARGLRVITELVLNHTSNQHPWFQRARRSPKGSRERDFYVWGDTPDKYRDARIIFKEFEPSNWSWEPSAKQYYWHRFYAHQPDLNFDNPAVHQAVYEIVDFWLGMGVDGLRLDAVPYLYEREGTNCENLPETHAFLRELRAYIDKRYQDRVLLGEANQWPEDAAAFFGNGDECHALFHFPLMPRLYMAIQTEDRFPIVDILAQTPAVPEQAQWFLFLRNHDELTLEMVTDEERDYMWRVYAKDPVARLNLGIRRRLAPLLGNDRRRVELMNALLFTLPGTPVIYYGDELGVGDNMYLGDRNGVRTPMQWSSGRNAGFSECNPQQLYLPVIVDPEYHFEALNVEAQDANPNSLLWWMRRTTAIRNQYQAMGRGKLEFLQPANRKVLAYFLTHEDERILVVANLSRYSQYVELDLTTHRGTRPIELVGRTEFPAVGERPYTLTLGPYGFYWFELPPSAPKAETIGQTIPVLLGDNGIRSSAAGLGEDLEPNLGEYLVRARWYRGKGRKARSLEILDSFALEATEAARLLLVRVDYYESEPETYLVPIARIEGPRAAELAKRSPHHVLAARVSPSGLTQSVLADGAADAATAHFLLDYIVSGRRSRGVVGELIGSTTPLQRSSPPDASSLLPALIGGDQSNSTIAFGNEFVLKLFRVLHEGVNPEVEIGRYLSESRGFQNIPPLLGTLEYRAPGRAPITVAVLQRYLKNEGNAWSYALDELAAFLERARVRSEGARDAPPRQRDIVSLAATEPPPLARELIGFFLESIRTLGRRTAEMHLAFAAPVEDPDFAPEPYTSLSRRSLYQSLRNQTRRVFNLLGQRLATLAPPAKDLATRAIALEEEVLRRHHEVIEAAPHSLRTRHHGDFHLAQVLYTGKDFVFIDFEGEPLRPVSERRIKRSPLRDVAGMIRSFHYASATALQTALEKGAVGEEDRRRLRAWADYWYDTVAARFLRTYLERAGTAEFLPTEPGRLKVLLTALLLEKCTYEIGYELENRPELVTEPLRGLLDLLGVDA